MLKSGENEEIALETHILPNCMVVMAELLPKGI